MSESPSGNGRIIGMMDFKSPFLTEIFDWSVSDVLSKVWDSGEWNRCAKGGNETEKFARHNDMDYLAHIFSGISMALKVLDYRYQKTPVNENDLATEVRSLKRSIFCYLFHDYNKITGADYRMADKSSLAELVNRYFDGIKSNLDLTDDEVYQVVFSTEKGTSYNIIKDSNQRSNMIFESNFSELADKLSSRFNDEAFGGVHNEELSIYWGSEPIVPGKSLKKIRFSTTSLYACEDVARKASKITIENYGGFYLWSTNRSVFFVMEGDESIILSNLEKTFGNLVDQILEPENLLSFNDRSVINSASGIVRHTSESISRYVDQEDKFRKCMWLEDIEINSSNRTSAEEYSDAVRPIVNSFSINFRTINERKKTSLRNGLEVNEGTDAESTKERLKIFMSRYVQLKTTLDSPEASKLRALLESTLKKYEGNILKGLLGKIPKNSALLLPFLTHETDIDWSMLMEEILSDLNHGQNTINYGSILSTIVVSNMASLRLPKVPGKFNMSMVNAYPASEKATGENLSGLNTQTFNNRLPTSGISNGKIDKVSKFEFALRKNLVPQSKSSDECLMFLSFPGAIPFIDMSAYLTHLSYTAAEELSEINDLKLSIDAVKARSREVRLDSAYFYSVRDLKSESEVLRRIYQAANLYKRTKMLIRLAFSNAPFFQDQQEVIRIEVGSSICSAMGWDKIRCNQVDRVLDQISTFNVAVNGSVSKMNFKETANVILDYVNQPMSLFYYVHKLVFGGNGKKRVGFGKQFSEKIESLRKLGYGVENGGEKKMKNVTELAKSAARMVKPKWNMSGNDRTWMLRDSLEVIEKVRVSITTGEDRDLSEYREFIAGNILKSLERDKDISWMPKEGDIADFADKLIRLLKEDFNSMVPAGSMKSYLIDAFEFEYMRNGKGDEN